jgi:hypothetical protein
MSIAEKKKFYKVRLLYYRIRHGLFLFTLRNILSRTGLDIDLYYWFRELKKVGGEPQIKGNIKDYEMVYISPGEIKILDNIMGLNAHVLEQNMIKGQLCIGLKHREEIAALLFIELNDFYFKDRFFELEEHAAYLLNLYTFDAYKGKNLAAYLKYHCFDLLEKYDISKIYSINSYFNTSSLKVKKKMGARKLKLYLYIGLFKKRYWNFLLREYPD